MALSCCSRNPVPHPLLFVLFYSVLMLFLWPLPFLPFHSFLFWFSLSSPHTTQWDVLSYVVRIRMYGKYQNRTRNFCTHTFPPTIGKRMQPVLVILIHPGTNVLLTHNIDPIEVGKKFPHYSCSIVGRRDWVFTVKTARFSMSLSFPHLWSSVKCLHRYLSYAPLLSLPSLFSLAFLCIFFSLSFSYHS